MAQRQSGLVQAKVRRSGDSSGGGTLTSLTSADNSVTVANPAGPVADLSIPVAERFPGFGNTPPLVSSTSKPGVAATAARSDHTHGSTVADWGTPASVRFFAVDGTIGSDTNAGYSDVSQAAAGAVAVATIAKLLTILPKFGNARRARIAIRSGNYVNDATIDLSGFAGYQILQFIGTNTVASAGAVAFAGDSNDTICAGMATPAGLNATGYNMTAYTVAADGTVTATLQLAGGGAPGFGAMPAAPYGCRLRGDVATTTAALHNATSGVISSTGGATLILSQALPAAPVLGNAGDVFYLESPGVTGPTSTLIQMSGGEGSASPAMQLVGLSLGTVRNSFCGARFVACTAGIFIGFHAEVIASYQTLDPALGTFKSIGVGLVATSSVTLKGSLINITDSAFGTAAAQFLDASALLWERSACGGSLYVAGGTRASGNNTIETIGTNSSTAHGSTCQIWGTAAAPSGFLRCGLGVYAGANVGRVALSNMGGNPGIRAAGAGQGLIFQALVSGAAGNTDVGLDLSPNGIVGNASGSFGASVSLAVLPTATGGVGDVRLADGTIVSWATAAAGLVDVGGNQLFAPGNAPGHPIAVAAGAVAVAITNAPAGSPATPARYVKFPDGAGGFYTFPSLT